MISVEIDGGVTPPKVVHVEPYFLDATPVTNKEFSKFVSATYYETEAEKVRYMSETKGSFRPLCPFAFQLWASQIFHTFSTDGRLS